MKIIQIKNGVVVDILNARNDATNDSIRVAEKIPSYVPKDGYSGVLRYTDEKGLYWGYEAIPETDEISDTEALNIIVGGDAE